MSKLDTKLAEATTSRQKPVLIAAAGRQRVGKTLLLNALVELYRKHGADIEVWNADLHNKTHTLSMFHSDALQPHTEGSVSDQRAWLEERITSQVRHKRDVVLDIGGGMTALNSLVEQVRLVPLLERRGIRPVLFYVLGSERADLDYLEQFARNSTFTPEATVLVFNSGLVTGGRSPDIAFAPLFEHPAVRRALGNKARSAILPALGCMSEVTNRGLNFIAFAEGAQVDGFDETSFFDQERTWLWLTREMTQFFAEIPPEWLPHVSRPLGSDA